MNFLNLIRWKNLLLIALVQYLIKYTLLEPFLGTVNLSVTLSFFGFTLLVLATLCLAAAGYIINDIYDIEIDKVNRPERVIVGNSISEKTANTLFITFNIAGVLIGFYLSNLIGKNGFFALFVIISALLYIYATYLKQMLLVGNFVISILVALSLIIVGLFDLLPAITPENQETQITFFKIILDYAVFAFVINFIREIVKDIEDIDGEYKAGFNTLPIAFGRNRAIKVVFALSIMLLFGVVYYIITFLYSQLLVVAYFLTFIMAPLIYICIKSYTAETKKELRLISNLLKLVMLIGILSMALYQFVLLG
ncbi:geranylgeranylglycerol-phosphate geranylgeranyltransferase [Xanthomarina sp. F2636L]|uniref:geranylgeranylglycerol-phosphate geranylgeranyltransferase n=1 Tax=Xanthomarina sp. F2636L TaxID=2996018 RepID=UPI00225E43EC|nr:geranylgeranylglycerol-phosphate geranylgeranyltransferase [Xanthomarina sp. F2636L]MCX7550331.1 geranylgeranylglycerol-phosphate geranylgeranyltransferase [Xanthomarina sp. F2636L]